MEPRAIPAATRGQELCPHIPAATAKTDSKQDAEHQDSNNPGSLKHLKSVVLPTEPQLRRASAKA